MNNYFNYIVDKLGKFSDNIPFNDYLIKEQKLDLYLISIFDKDPYRFLSSCYMLFCNNFVFNMSNNACCALYDDYPDKSHYTHDGCDECKYYSIYENTFRGLPELAYIYNNKSILNYGITI